MLGTCGMMPMPGRWLSCALIRCGSSLTLVDCGEGTQVPWKALGWGFRQLGAICLTHMHADHVAGLPGVLFRSEEHTSELQSRENLVCRLLLEKKKKKKKNRTQISYNIIIPMR